MRKTFFSFGKIIVLCLFILPLRSHAGCVIRIGHPTGTYKSVGENPTGSELTCSGDGSVTCEWNNGDQGCHIYVNGNLISEALAQQIVQQNINNAVTSGQVQGDNGIGYYIWYYDANNVFRYRFDDGQIN